MNISVFTDQVYSAVCHFAVVDNREVLAASFIGRASSIKEINRAVQKGKNIDIIDRYSYKFKTKGEYQVFVSDIDEYVSHGMFYHESFLSKGEGPHYILSPDGSKDIIPEFISELYTLPAEWEDEYLSLFDRWISPVTVMVNKKVDKWKNLKAFKLTVTEEEVTELINKALQVGRLSIPKGENLLGKFDPNWDLKEYLVNNAEGIASEIESLKPYHDTNNPDRVLNKNIATMGRIPLPAQADGVQAVYNRLQEANYAFINGDMGSGKSIMLNALLNVWHKENKSGYTPVLLTAPAVVIPKWIKDELLVDIPYAKLIEINSTEDALRYVREVRSGKPRTGLEIVLLSIDRAKLGPRWVGAAIWKRIKGTYRDAWHCPECMGVLNDPVLRDQDRLPLPASWQSMALSDRGVYPIKWKTNSKLNVCHHCGSKLWRPAVKGRDEGAISRWPISSIFSKYLKGHFEIYAADEIHKQKNDSQRGRAFGELVKSAKKVVGLTGTLTNGMSTALKEIFWYLDPKSLLSKGFDYSTGTIRWANSYGAVETQRRVEYRDGDRVRRSTRVLERPGISPRLTVDYLLGSTVFLELKDLGLPLVAKKEIPVFIDMDPSHGIAYEEFHEKLMDVKRRTGSIVPAMLNYADNPSRGGQVVFKNKREDERDIVVTAPKLPGLSSKERKLIEILKDNLEEDRGVVIFTNYSGAYGINKRISQVLTEAGISHKVLPSSLSSDRRVEWLEKQALEEQKVIISNLNLIGEGLDLLPWPSLVFYQISYSVDAVRQSGGRAWRIGQLREARNYYLIMNNSQQIPQFETVMARRGHALLVEGKIDKSVLGDYAQDAFSTLAANIAECLATPERMNKLSNIWGELAVADMDGVETIEESEYRKTVQAAMKRLTEETKRLCRVDPSEILGDTWLPKLILIERKIKRGKRVLAEVGQLALDIS